MDQVMKREWMIAEFSRLAVDDFAEFAADMLGRMLFETLGFTAMEGQE